MAGWYKQHTSELASLEAFATCGRMDLIVAWLRVTRWSVDHESDELPPNLTADADALEAVGLRTTFAQRCKKLLDQREAMQNRRELKKVHVSSRELTSDHVSSSDHQDKTIQDDTRPDETTKRMEPSAPAPVQPRKKPSRELPPDWAPSEAHRAKARELGIDLDHEEELFRNDAAANARRYADWEAAFRNWIARSAKWKKPAGAPAKPAIVKGWNDETHMNGIPKGTSW